MTDDEDHNPLRHPAGDRTSGDVSLLRIEADLVAEGAELDNPARPADAETAERLHERLDADVRPAWEVVG
jgi:hypothetical protein